MNEEQNQAIEAIASTWTVKTTDLTQRVAAAIGSAEPRPDVTAELLEEIRALRREMDGFCRANAQLHEEVVRLRQDLTSRKAVRLAPYAPIDRLVRLS